MSSDLLVPLFAGRALHEVRALQDSVLPHPVPDADDRLLHDARSILGLQSQSCILTKRYPDVREEPSRGAGSGIHAIIQYYYCRYICGDDSSELLGDYSRHYRMSPVTPMPEVRRAKFLVVFFCL